MGTICLASQSEDRRKLFSSAHLNFFTQPADIDETRREGESPEDYVIRLSREKAGAVREDLSEQHTPPLLIVGADTVVVRGERVLGKPRSHEDAVNMLMELSGETHEIITGLTVIDVTREEKISELSRSKVRFSPMTEDEVSWYVETFSPLRYAGAYEMAGLSSWFVDSVEGSPSNVRGLPMSLLKRVINRLGYNWMDFVSSRQSA